MDDPRHGDHWTITANTRCFLPVLSMALNFAAVVHAAATTRGKFPVNASTEAYAHCFRTPIGIILPAGGLFEGIFAGRHLDEMTLRYFGPIPTNALPTGSAGMAIGLQTQLVAGGAFALFFGECLEWLEAGPLKGQHYSWPVALRFSRAVRNAIAHRGHLRWENDKAPSVTWRGLTLGPDDKDRPLFENGDLSQGDLLQLMREANEEMLELGAPP